MPNWTENKLRITGPATEQGRFMAQAKVIQKRELPEPEISDPIEAAATKLATALNVEAPMKTELSFSAFLPLDPEDSASEKWGTKWDACTVEMHTTKSSVLYTFETAWSPPGGALRAMAKQFPALRFSMKYWECGMGFKGHIVYENGKVVKDVSERYVNGQRGG